MSGSLSVSKLDELCNDIIMKVKRPQPKQPTPSNAKKVFEGIIYDVYQWEQEAYDGSVRVFEQVKRADSIGIIPITTQGKIVVLKQKQPGYKDYFYSIPGGRLEKNEDPLLCATRELEEETGYTTSEVVLWDASQRVPKIDCVRYIFIGLDCVDSLGMKLDGAEKVDLELVNFKQFVDIVLGPNFRDFNQAVLFAQALHNPEKHLRYLKLLGYK